MEVIMEYWYIALGLLAVLAAAGQMVRRWLALPREQQLEGLRQWLLWAVNEAEEALGGGTGQRKLRMVYDMFLVRFPQVARVMTFETFSALVDEALEQMEGMLEDREEERV